MNFNTNILLISILILGLMASPLSLSSFTQIDSTGLAFAQGKPENPGPPEDKGKPEVRLTESEKQRDKPENPVPPEDRTSIRETKMKEKELRLTEKIGDRQLQAQQKGKDLRQQFQDNPGQLKKSQQALLSNVDKGKYLGRVLNGDPTTTTFTLDVTAVLTPIGSPSENESIDESLAEGHITMQNVVTRGNNLKLEVKDCQLFVNLDENICAFGKARTSGLTGEKDSMIILAFISDDFDNRGTIKLLLQTDSFKELSDIGDSVTVDILSPQSRIGHEWFVDGTGTMSITDIINTPSIDTATFVDSADEESEQESSDDRVSEIENIPLTTSISISISKEIYFLGDEIEITGSVDEIFEDIPVILQIVTTDDLIEIAQIELDSDGAFKHIIQAIGSQWQVDDTYTVKAFYGGNNITQTTFEFFVE